MSEAEIRVRGTEILATDTRQQYREKIARITLDSMVQFVGLLDADGTVLEINKVALDAVGIDLSQVEGKPFWTTFWWQVSEEIRAELRRLIGRAAAGEFVRWDTPIFGRAGGRETIIIDASLCPVFDDHGKVVFICAEGRDITEKKAQEREIAEKNVELQGLLERIRELDEIRTQFFANVSHELRTPLALIIGPAERLLKPEVAAQPAEQRETAEVIVRNARMLLKHVNDLLDLSKLEAGKLKLELRDTDVAALVRFMASHFDVLAAERGVHFVVDTPPSLLAAVDPEKLQRVVMNLLSNAFKFVPASGRVRCALRLAEGALVLDVEDSGPGVRPELRKAIFERFRQGDGGANRQSSGTGLGLAIADEFVAMHQGAIEVHDSSLGGARFQVAVPHQPIATAEQLTAADEVLDPHTLTGLLEELRVPSAAPARGGDVGRSDSRATVLVVEDNADMNRFVAQCLSADYHVRTAFDGQQGLEQALAHHPDLIVSDIMMPRVSGEQMIAALRQHPEMDETPILLLSAKADEELKSRLLEEGAQDFVTKPFSERDLLVRARNLIAVRQSRELLRDVEKAKRSSVEATNRELVERTQQLSALFQQAPSFIAVLRGRGHVFELTNSAFDRLIGHRDIIGRSVVEALPEIPDQGFIELLDRVFLTGAPHVGRSVAVLLQRGDGAALEQRYVDFIFQPLLANDGSVVGVFVEGSDVTDRQQAEDALRAADRRKDEFLATLAHELRNPLAPIRHAARISKMPGATDAQMKWSQEVVGRQVEHMARLLDDLLEVSRITRGRLELRKQRLVLQETLVEAVETVRPQIEARGHQLVIELPPAPIHIDADPVRVAQIFSNLLLNAAKYTDAGGLIRVQATLANDQVSVHVQDNGIGIAPELLPEMFEMFSQATSALDRSEGGLGIGLSLARGLVALHGGSIEARSPGLGLGSDFVVTLPLAPTGRAAHVAAGGALSPAGNARPVRVLVADDNHDSADSCAMLLEMAGHEVRVAYSGSQALALAAEFRPQIALLDIGMPEMNGYELARLIRAAPWGRDMLLAAVSGWGQDEDRRQAEAAGFDHHSTKPIDFDALAPLFARCTPEEPEPRA